MQHVGRRKHHEAYLPFGPRFLSSFRHAQQQCVESCDLSPVSGMHDRAAERVITATKSLAPVLVMCTYLSFERPDSQPASLHHCSSTEGKIMAVADWLVRCSRCFDLYGRPVTRRSNYAGCFEFMGGCSETIHAVSWMLSS